MKLKDRVAVVTGGVSGIGQSICLALAHEGAVVVPNYRKSEGDAKTTAAKLEDLGSRYLLARADVSLEAEVEAMLDQVMGAFGRVDILVNNAGTWSPASFFETDVPTWDHIMAVNLRGPFICTKSFGQAMLQQGGGSIVNITSRLGFVPEGSSASYSVSKAGLVMLTRCAAAVLAPSVRVNAVAPAFVQTPWHAKFGFDLDQLSDLNAARTPLRRPGTPEDIASAVVFLASDEASFITGQTLVVDGGRTMR